MGKFKSKKRDIDQESSDLFLEELQASMADAKAQGETWEKPWFTVSVEAPTSGSTGKEYKGMNWWNLNLIANRYGWQGKWITGKNAMDRGWILKGKKSEAFVFQPNLIPQKEDSEGIVTRKAFTIFKPIAVFNESQFDEFEAPEQPDRVDLVKIYETAEDFVKNTGAIINKSQGSRAFYNVTGHEITIPQTDIFKDTSTSTATENYYGTLFHELTHWTLKDLKRDEFVAKMYPNGVKKFGSKRYAFEELVAEIGAAMLCQKLNISQSIRSDHAKYLNSWVEVVKEDKTVLRKACTLAQKAVEHLVSFQEQEELAEAA